MTDKDKEAKVLVQVNRLLEIGIELDQIEDTLNGLIDAGHEVVVEPEFKNIEEFKAKLDTDEGFLTFMFDFFNQECEVN